MKRLLLALPLAALSVVGLPTSHAFAQEAKTVHGTVTDIGGSSVTVKIGAQEMKFSVDNKTRVEARGASTKSREAAASGKPGPFLGDVIKVGQAVSVHYQDMDGSRHATLIRAMASAGPSGGSIAPPSSEHTANGTVKSMGPGSLTISGASSGGATFTQTFVIDSNTKVVGKGAGTTTAARGGRAPFTELIANGDTVSVSYYKTGNTLHVSDVRIVMRAAH
jgi:hypothetical protein